MAFDGFETLLAVTLTLRSSHGSYARMTMVQNIRIPDGVTKRLDVFRSNRFSDRLPELFNR